MLKLGLVICVCEKERSTDADRSVCVDPGSEYDAIDQDVIGGLNNPLHRVWSEQR